MGAFIDLTGQRFGKLTVIERAENKGHFVYWLCKCDCGAEKIVRGQHLRGGKTVSCGCYGIYASAQAKIKRNKIEICGDYAKIYLSNCDDVCLIDSADVDKVKDYCWSKSHYGYVHTHINMQQRVLIHRVLFNLPYKDSRVVDHINHNTLDNRRSNLRVLDNNTLNLHNYDRSKTRSSTGMLNVYKTKRTYFFRYKRFGQEYNGYGYATAEQAHEALIQSYKEHNFIYGE